MIEKYEEMVQNDFRPLFVTLQDREREIKDNVETIVKKEVGIYDDYVLRAKLNLQIEELDKKIDRWEDRNRNNPDNRYISKLELAVEKRLKDVMNGERDLLENARDEALRNVRLMAIDDDMRDSLREVYTTVTELKEKLAALPPVGEKVKALMSGSSGKKGKK
jgi:hypothetical protein